MPGEGTGTPAASGSTATLASLRDRVRVMVEAVAGAPDPLVVTAANTDIDLLRTRLANTLKDASAEIWEESDLTEALRKALEQYSRVSPNSAIGTKQIEVASREIDISDLANVSRVERVWWNYDESDPGYAPNWKQFQVWPGAILFIEDEDIPQIGDVVRVWYTKPHTISGLDEGDNTTIPNEDIGYIVTGAAGFALLSRAVALVEEATLNSKTNENLRKLAEEHLANFRAGVNKQQPAWQRNAFAYSQDDIHEALRWALHRYSLVEPDVTIATLALEADGREIDISSLDDMLKTRKVWLPYEADEPARWRSFEQWPGDVLYISDGYEPNSGDVARIWYTRLHALSGLDSATVTTIAPDVETLIVIGAAGLVAQMRAQERNVETFVPSKLREWAEARLAEFEDSLKRIRNKPAGGFVAWQPARRRRVPRS